MRCARRSFTMFERLKGIFRKKTRVQGKGDYTIAPVANSPVRYGQINRAGIHHGPATPQPIIHNHTTVVQQDDSLNDFLQTQVLLSELESRPVVIEERV